MLGNFFKKKHIPCKDELVIRALQQNGSNVTKLHYIDFWFDFNNNQSAQNIAEELSKKGYSCEVIISKDNGLFTCKANRGYIPELGLMRSLTHDFYLLAQTHNGVYDGWGTEIVK